jgi:DNA polymerase-3 subunit delta
MQVPLEGLAARLEKALPGLAWVHSDEALLELEACDSLRAAFRRAGASERQVHQVERHFDWQALAMGSGNLSLFASQSLVELRLSKKPTAEIGEALAHWCNGLDENTKVIVSSPRLDKKLTESKWMQALQAWAQGVWLIPIYAVTEDRLGPWIVQRLQAQGQKVTPGTLAFLTQQVQGNLLAAHQELRKLALLCPPGLLAEEDVRSAVSDVARYSTFDVAQAMLEGQASKALRALHHLQAEGETVILALWAITQALRTLDGLLRALGAGEPWANAARSHGLFAQREQPYRSALQRLRKDQWPAVIQRALREAAEVDRMAKGLTSPDMLDAWNGLERVVLRVAGLHVLEANPSPILNPVA